MAQGSGVRQHAAPRSRTRSPDKAADAHAPYDKLFCVSSRLSSCGAARPKRGQGARLQPQRPHRRRDVAEHECLGGTAQRVGHQHGQAVVAIRHVRLLGGERIDDVAQGRQRHVDSHGLLQLLARGAGFLHALAARQVHEAELAARHRLRLQVGGLDDDAEDLVAAAALRIHQRARRLAPRHALLQRRRQICVPSAVAARRGAVRVSRGRWCVAPWRAASIRTEW